MLLFKGAARRKEEWYELGVFIAWHTALFQRAKTLPELGPMLKKIRKSRQPAEPQPKAQTWQEMKAVMKAISITAASVPVVLPKKRKPVPIPKRPTRRV